MTLKAILSSFLCVLALSACTLDTRPGTGAGSVSSACADGGMSAACSGTGAAANGGNSSSALHVDGDNCAADLDCQSGHCNHSVCCSTGDCCRTQVDCPNANASASGVGLACNEPSKCQGNGGSLVCNAFRCVVLDGMPDDSGCTTQHQAKSCAPYKPVFCNGMPEQTEPACGTSCKQDTDCASTAHCVGGACENDIVVGGVCERDSDCGTSHCSNGLCCKDGDCCKDNSTCGKYASPAACTDPKTCTGARKDAVCMASQCESVEIIDPSGCKGAKVADCGDYADAVCTDRMVPSVCDTTCLSHSQCKDSAYCSALDSGNAGTCKPKLKDGDRCSVSQQCDTGCSDGVCCGDTGPNAHCCSVQADCMDLESSGCVADDNTCAGQVTTAICNATSHRCVVETHPDSMACKRMLDCGDAYRAGAFSCPMTCRCSNSVMDCAAGYECNRQTSQCVRAMGAAGMSGMSSAGSSGMPGNNSAGAAGRP